MQIGQQFQPPPVPTEEQALDYLIENLRQSPDGLKRDGHDVHIAVIAEYYVRERARATNVSPHDMPPNSGLPNLIESVSGPFLSAAWYLSRIGVLRPGRQQLKFDTGVRDQDVGYSFTEYGRKWIAEAPPKLVAHPGKAINQLHTVGAQFGDAYMLRSQDAVLAYNGHAYFACCAMVGAAAEAILLVAAGHKLGEEQATSIYMGSTGRSRLQTKLLGQQPDRIRTEFERNTELISYWRDQASHGHQTGIKDGEAFAALSGLLKFAHFAADNWGDLTKP
jgi:hypothetical protein